MEKTTESKEPELGDDPLIGPLFVQTEEEERATLNQILSDGVDQGWLLRPPAGQVITDAGLVNRVCQELELRPQVRPDERDPWRHRLPPPPRDLGSDPAWVILSQRCDLIRGYALEPVVELAPAVRIDDKGEARKARINSTRLIAIASDERGVFATEMRSRAWLPKHLLPGVQEQHPAIADQVALKRFRHRLGGRYWRDAVPDDLRQAFAVPLSKAFSKGARNRLLRHFSMLLGRRIGEHVLVLAVVAPNATEDEARVDWDEALEELRRIAPGARAMLHEGSEPLAEQDLSVAEWLDLFKFDFDDLTYGSGSSEGHAPVRI